MTVKQLQLNSIPELRAQISQTEAEQDESLKEYVAQTAGELALRQTSTYPDFSKLFYLGEGA